MGKGKKYKPEEIVKKLREADVLLSEGLSISAMVKQIAVSVDTYHRWRREYGGMKVAQAKRFKDLEKENVRLKKLVAEPIYITPGSPWENGYCESFNGKMRYEFLNGEIFYSLKEAEILIERWRVHYNTVRPHSALGGKPPAPKTLQPDAG